MKSVFGNKKKVLIGMIHLLPTMSFSGFKGIDVMLAQAKKDLIAIEEGGMDGALIENDGDSPCGVLGTSDVTVPMTIVANELQKVSKIPLGVEVLLNDPKASLSIAKTCNLKFIRTDYFVDRMKRVGYGEFDIYPEEVMRYRSQIDADKIDVYADVQVKYATMITKKTISQSVSEAISKGASGVIVSGTKTGTKPNIEDLKASYRASSGRVPVIIGSGLAFDNAKELMSVADWAIVGTSIKSKGLVDRKKVKELVRIVKGI